MRALATLPDDVVSAIRQAQVTAATVVIRVEVTGDVGYLFFLEGELVHASTLELEGETAVSAILSFDEVGLSYCERRWPRERSVKRSWTELVPRAATAPAQAEPDLSQPVADRDQGPESTGEVHFPSALGLRQVLDRTEFLNALRLSSAGNVSDSRGSTAHLKPILRSTLTLGDSLGAALGLGPIMAAEASATGFHRLIARSAEGASAVETAGGNSLQLARAFLKLG